MTDRNEVCVHDRPARLCGLCVDREHDTQPDPIPNNHGNAQDAVIAAIEERKALGMAKYGTLLQPHNGRDMLKDAFEEALDLCCYLAGALMERDER